MSVTKMVTVWCNGCGTWEHTGHSAAEARRNAKESGWRVALAGVDECPPGHEQSLHWPGARRDLCPSCGNHPLRGATT